MAAPDPRTFLSTTVDEWLARAQEAGELEQAPSRQCRVCRDPVIMSIVNKMLARASSAPDILDTLAAYNRKLKGEGKPVITEACLYNHRDRHFDIQAPAVALWRRMQEKHAIEHGRDWREGVGTILNVFSYLETVGVRGYETLIDPTTPVSYDDGAKAMLKLHELAKADEGAFERAAMLAEMGHLIEVVREFVKPEDWPTLQARLRGEKVEVTKPQSVESVRVVSIDDTPDVEGN